MFSYEDVAGPVVCGLIDQAVEAATKYEPVGSAIAGLSGPGEWDDPSPGVARAYDEVLARIESGTRSCVAIDPRGAAIVRALEKWIRSRRGNLMTRLQGGDAAWRIETTVSSLYLAALLDALGAAPWPWEYVSQRVVDQLGPVASEAQLPPTPRRTVLAAFATSFAGLSGRSRGILAAVGARPSTEASPSPRTGSAGRFDRQIDETVAMISAVKRGCEREVFQGDVIDTTLVKLRALVAPAFLRRADAEVEFARLPPALLPLVPEAVLVPRPVGPPVLFLAEPDALPAHALWRILAHEVTPGHAEQFARLSYVDRPRARLLASTYGLEGWACHAELVLLRHEDDLVILEALSQRLRRFAVARDQVLRAVDPARADTTWFGLTERLPDSIQSVLARSRSQAASLLPYADGVLAVEAVLGNRGTLAREALLALGPIEPNRLTAEAVSRALGGVDQRQVPATSSGRDGPGAHPASAATRIRASADARNTGERSSMRGPVRRTELL